MRYGVDEKPGYLCVSVCRDSWMGRLPQGPPCGGRASIPAHSLVGQVLLFPLPCTRGGAPLPAAELPFYQGRAEPQLATQLAAATRGIRDDAGRLAEKAAMLGSNVGKSLTSFFGRRK